MLTEQCNALKQEIARYAALRQAKENADRYRGRRDEVMPLPKQLEAPLTPRATLVRHGIAVAAPAEAINRLATRLSEVSSAYKADPSSIIQPQALGKPSDDLKARTAAVRLSMDGALQVAWQGYTGQHVGSTSSALLVVLEQIQAFRATVQRIGALQQRLASICALPPRNDEEFDQFHEVLTELRRLWGAFDGLPPDVLQFLKALGSDSASLDLLTDTVRHWLQEHGLERAFYVVSR